MVSKEKNIKNKNLQTLEYLKNAFAFRNYKFKLR